MVVTDNSNGTGKLLIKRVVAVAGDTIRIDYTSGQVYLNLSLIHISPEVKEKVYGAVETLKAQGAEIVEVSLPSTDYICNPYL